MGRKKAYRPGNYIRIVTATSLFDGHDAAINIMRRILQSSGAEVIHLGHNRSVEEIVGCAIQEDVQAIAVTSYQGGHMEFFRYMRELLDSQGYSHVMIFGGGGGVILPGEIKELRKAGIARIYSPDDGRKMGLQGMINDVLKRCDFPRGKDLIVDPEKIRKRHIPSLAVLISAAENFKPQVLPFLKELERDCLQAHTPVLGVTGTGGSGKSSLIDELARRFLKQFKKKTLAIISADPSRRRSGGALLGDRIRMNAIHHPAIFMRSLATRQANISLSKHIREVLCIVKSAGFDLVILETSGIGQSSSEVVDYCDVALYVMTPEFGASTQLEKIDMLDFSDIVVLNKSDKQGAEDALKAVRKQYQRNHALFDRPLEEMPVVATVASQFHDRGTDHLYRSVIELLAEKAGFDRKGEYRPVRLRVPAGPVIPPRQTRYLSEIADTVREYNRHARKQADLADRLYSLNNSITELQKQSTEKKDEMFKGLRAAYRSLEKMLDASSLLALKGWAKKREKYAADEFRFQVRDKQVKVLTYTESLSHTRIPKIVLPGFRSWGDILEWNLLENVPGEFPFAAGVYPFKRETESPTRMFAGEGGPERTNKRFHYVSRGMPARRLSTAFDSVTLYGADPATRPDIFGKVGNSGVSVACLDDCKKLYSGFNLLDTNTSVSMTINGPAPILAAYFLNTAIDQQCELYIRNNGLETTVRKKIRELLGENPPRYQGELPEENDGLGLMLLGVTGDQVLPSSTYEQIKKDTLARVRGTLQADILKEDQAQNTCIFSTQFALKMMGDIQEYFIENHVRNFYSVSISGYHIAEAGANPITQLAFTLANGFTYVEYYLARGMKIDDFAPNLSFFFSNGLDPEYTVIGRVARIIWAKALRYRYRANMRSQKLKYHIQTSGRSLHAQEIEFNDIRTTLQALNAVYDNCNSLHTNAYDEAITTPTEESVRRALAIQLIIDQEMGLSKNQNPLQGSFIIRELTGLVEEAVLSEFDRITERGGVLGAMETMYQRIKIQEESLYYETLKHNGGLPVVGVNTFLDPSGSPTMIPGEVTRSTRAEKEYQVNMIRDFRLRYRKEAGKRLRLLQQTVLGNGNTFPPLMEASKCCSLGQITDALYEVGGMYRRNI